MGSVLQITKVSILITLKYKLKNLARCFTLILVDFALVCWSLHPLFLTLNYS